MGFRLLSASTLVVGALALSACDRSDAQSPARDHSGSRPAIAARGPDRPHTPPPMVNGKPEWADNRQHSAQENLTYQFEHWGSALGAKDQGDYAKRAHAFIDHPPKNAEKITRPNGDVMLYDKASNTFAIARRDGAPRLFRKPADGVATWDKAKSDANNTSGGRYQKRYHAPSAGDYRSSGD